MTFSLIMIQIAAYMWPYCIIQDSHIGESGASCNIFNILVFLQVIINFMNEVILSS